MGRSVSLHSSWSASVCASQPTSGGAAVASRCHGRTQGGTSRYTKAHGADALHSCRVRCVRAGSQHRRRHVKLEKAKSASCLEGAVLLTRPFNSSLCSLARVPWANHRWSCASCVGNSSTTRCLMLRINGDVKVEMNTVPSMANPRICQIHVCRHYTHETDDDNLTSFFDQPYWNDRSRPSAPRF